MKEIVINSDFDISEVTSKINAIMSKWSIKLLDINGPDWAIYTYQC